MLDSTRLVKVLGALAALFFVVVVAGGLVLALAGTSTATDHRISHEFFRWAPWFFAGCAVVLLADFVSGIRSQRLTTSQVSAHRTLAFLLLLLTGFALGGDDPDVLPVAIGAVCFLAMLVVPRKRAAASRWDPVSGRQLEQVPATGSGTSGAPAAVSLGGVETPVRWHLPQPTPGGPAPGEHDPRAAWAVVGDPAALRAVPTSARVDYDRDVWLKAPYDPADYDAWVQASLTDATRRLAVTGDSAPGMALRSMLTEFVRRDVGTPNRLLRLGDEAGAVPMVATFSVLAGLPDSDADDVFGSYLPDRGYEHEPRTKVVDADRQLVRSLRQTRHEDQDATLSVRYHRRVADLGTDVMLACEGAGLVAASQALSDLDALAAAVWVVDAQGRRR